MSFEPVFDDVNVDAHRVAHESLTNDDASLPRSYSNAGFRSIRARRLTLSVRPERIVTQSGGYG